MSEISAAAQCMIQMALHNYAIRIAREGQPLSDWNSQAEDVLKMISHSETLCSSLNEYAANGSNLLMIVPGKDTSASVQANNSQGGMKTGMIGEFLCWMNNQILHSMRQ